MVIFKPPIGDTPSEDSNAVPTDLSHEDMLDTITSVDENMRKGVHGIIFCSSVYFGRWHNKLKNYGLKNQPLTSDGKKATVPRLQVIQTLAFIPRIPVYLKLEMMKLRSVLILEIPHSMLRMML